VVFNTAFPPQKREDAHRFFTETGANRAPSWRNEITLRSIEYAAGYLLAAYTPFISPTPLLLILAEGDSLPLDIAVAAFAARGGTEEAYHAQVWAL
jgi:hypothetical protein